MGPDEEIAKLHRETKHIKERLEILYGDRNRASLPQAAVRYEDLAGLGGITAEPTARPAAGATPTKDEYDALFNDVRKIMNVLAGVASGMRSKSQK